MLIKEEVTKWLYQKEGIQVQGRVKEEVLRKFTFRASVYALTANRLNCRIAYAACAVIIKAGR